MFVGASIFLWGVWFSWTPASTSECESELYSIVSGYPGANIGSCEAQDDSVVVYIEPEDSPPINPSPWYGFKVVPNTESNFNLSVRLVYPEDFQHRYGPHLSYDQLSWTRIPEKSIVLDDEGATTFRLSIDGFPLFVSAQENVQQDWYDDWLAMLYDDGFIRQPLVAGYSLDKRPIEVYQTNPTAPTYILLLGRSHPPEVTGAFTMKAFINHLNDLQSLECSRGLTTTCSFFAQTNFVIVPVLNPDGVVRGHWRHNKGSTDLNRDWGPFVQPETRAIRNVLNKLDEESTIVLMLDFHSTNRDVLYIQSEDNPTDPPSFTSQWFDRVLSLSPEDDENGYPAGFEPAPRPSTKVGTSKNYFYLTYGIPSITFETGDNTDRINLNDRVSLFAHALVDVLVKQQLEFKPSSDSICQYVFERKEPCRDFWCFMVEVNKATLVSSSKLGLLDMDVASFVATLLEISREADDNEELRSSNYAVMEERLIDRSGKHISNIHIGRSRQDLHGTVRRMLARQHWLDLYHKLLEVHQELINLASHHHESVIPTYTHGVPAEPSTLAHVLLAYGESLARNTKRLQEGYLRLNQSPYGAGVGNTSGVRLDRHGLANLLGFNSPVDNSFDANFVSSLDYKLELAATLEAIAIVTNQFVENIHAQQRDPWPWIWIVPFDAQSSRSTSMPQKRNPRDLDRLRTAANEVITMSGRITLHSHNVDAGMHDYRMMSNVSELAINGVHMLERYQRLLTQIQIDRSRALEAINQSFATSAQLAELLTLSTDHAFRDGYTLSAELVELGRSTGKSLNELSDDAIANTYTKLFGQELPLSITRIREAFDPIRMVLERNGVGGPQMSETQRMLRKQQQDIRLATRWYQSQLTHLNLTDIKLQLKSFDLCSSPQNGS